MINSRSLDELLPMVRTRVDKFLELCDEQGIDLLVTSTYRDHESQEIDSMRAELDRAKRDASFWRMIACALQNENRHSYANHG